MTYITDAYNCLKNLEKNFEIKIFKFLKNLILAIKR